LFSEAVSGESEDETQQKTRELTKETWLQMSWKNLLLRFGTGASFFFIDIRKTGLTLLN
jgi:hypothetical protein